MNFVRWCGVVLVVLSLDAAAATASAGMDGASTERYAEALQDAIRSKWTSAAGVSPNTVCQLRIRQLPGGEVVSVDIVYRCAYNDEDQRSLVAAVMNAQPLPYRGFEAVWRRDFVLMFRSLGSTKFGYASTAPAGLDPESRRMHPVVYPSMLASRGVTGEVILVVSTGSDGALHDVSVYRSSGSTDLDAAAVNAAKTWTYYPEIVNGQPRASRAAVPVLFELPPQVP